MSAPVALGPTRRRQRRAAPPEDGPLVDAFGRVHRDLRLSLTDRCNLRCTYCMPATGMTFQHRSEHLRTDELLAVARVARQLGVRSVRFTGGEPLLRADVVAVVEAVAGLGFEDVALTTNGSRLAALAPALAAAGLHRVNVSCDSLDPERFARIRRRGHLGVVLDAMDAAEQAGLGVKVNVVGVVGENDEEVEAFAAFGRDRRRTVRFIEFMPLDAEEAWERSLVLPAAEVLERIARCWPLEPVPMTGDPAPATRYRYLDGRGEVGVIASVTQPFCATCDRLRVTADGAVRNCLFARDELSVRDVLRQGGGDAEVAALLRRAVWGKRPGHGIDDPSFLRPARSMSMIGG